MGTKSYLTATLLAFLAASAIGLSQDAETGADLTFGRPTSTAVIGGCSYNAKTCANTSRYHTGVDYRSSETDPYVYASNRGTVARVEYVNWDDQGMGTNLILQHELASGGMIYTTYSHLSAIEPGIEVGTVVVKGQRIATMGGSGNGESNYWPIHLHFEIKDRAVTHNASGPGIYWGYTPTHPNGFGYHDPNSIYGTVEVKPPAANALVLLSPNSGRLKRGFNVSVEWVTDGAAEGDEVTIYLKRDKFSKLAHPDGRNYAVLAQAERNDGSFRTNVPISLAPARDWRVYVKLNGSGLSDSSNSRLKLK
jgi:murein DD-endopeptidase MepM/ murein hydrolase activator NlpD